MDEAASLTRDRSGTEASAAGAPGWRRPALVIGALTVARLVAVIGIHPYLYFDSAEYDILDFTGRSRRPWATPLLYRLVPGDHRWELTVQAVIGGVAWGVLALAVFAWFEDRRVGTVVAGAVAAVGLTTAVTNWDTTILSESLALSLTVLLVAAWLDLLRRRTWTGVLLVSAVAFPWLFVRQSLLPTGALIILTAAVAAAVVARRRGQWRHLAVAALVLALLTGLASASYAQNQEVVHLNLTVIVANRVAPDPERLDWFIDHGMPVPVGGLGFQELDTNPAFQAWVAGEGRPTYVQYLLTHPWYTFTEPLDDMVSRRTSYLDESVAQVTMLSPADSYGAARPVIPELAEQALFDPGATGTVLAAMVAVAALTAAQWRRRDRRWTPTLALTVISLGSLVGGWHGATPELNRLAMIGAVGLRIGLLIQFGLVAEAWIRHRRPVEVTGDEDVWAES